MVQNIRNMGGFFSDYFLGQLRESNLKGRLGEKTSRENFTKISRIYEKAELKFDRSTSKTQLFNGWVKHFLKILGYEENKNILKSFLIETEKEKYIADFAFYNSKNGSELNLMISDNKEPIILFDIQKWETSLNEKLGKGYDNTPLKRMRNKLAVSKAKWGMILNGPMVWLFKQQESIEEQSFFEVDIRSVFEESDREAFEIFWAIFRADAFYFEDDKPSLIEIIDIESRNHATKVGEFLKESVFQALELFMQGVLEDHSNKNIIDSYELKEIFHQAFIFMYRLLFIFYAESRELFPISHDIYRESYSLESIRIIIENPLIKFKANEYYIWESLQALFKLIDAGIDNGDLNITAFNGYLFSTEFSAFLSQIRLNDRELQQIISLLSTTPSQKHRGRERISYRELGVIQLGTIYEGLLEYEPKIAEEELCVLKEKGNSTLIPLSKLDDSKKSKVLEKIPKAKFYLSLSGGIRRSSGSYYTPEFITKFIVKQTLGPLVNNMTSEEILKFKILDPAMGSGTFLVSACHYLAEIYGQKLLDEEKFENENITMKEIMDHRRLIVENCLYGVDLNLMAVELAKVSLWLITATNEKPLNFLDHKLREGNSLVGANLKVIENLPNEIFLVDDVKKKNKIEKEKIDKTQKTLDRWFGTPFNIEQEIRKQLTYRGPEFLGGADLDLLTVKNKYNCYFQLMSKKSVLSKIKQIYNIWIACWFSNEDLEFPTTQKYREIIERVLLDEKLSEIDNIFLDNISRLKEKIQFFHWELEFPELFFEESSRFKKDFGFNAIIGNPPYISWSEITNRAIFEKKTYLDLKYDCRPRHQDAQPNIYLFFIIRSLNLISRGKIGLIIPQEWRFENYARKFRNYLLKKCSSIEIIRFNPNFKVFKSGKETIGTNSLIIFLNLEKNSDLEKKLIEYYIEELDEELVMTYLSHIDILKEISIKTEKEFKDLIDEPWQFALPQEEDLKKKIRSLPNIVDLSNSDCFQVKGGFQPPVESIIKFEITKVNFSKLTDKEKEFVFPAILEASEINRYFIDRKDRFWIVLNDINDEKTLKEEYPNLYELLSARLDTHLKDWWKFPNIRNFDLIKNYKLKLLSPRTAARNSFSVDERGSIFKGTNTMIISLEIDPYYVIGILNSSLGNFWYSKFGFEYHGERTKKYEPEKVRNYSIPIIRPSDENLSNNLSKCVKDLIFIERNLHNILYKFQNCISSRNYLDESSNLKFYLDRSTEFDINYKLFNNIGTNEGTFISLNIVEEYNKILIYGQFNENASNKKKIDLKIMELEIKDNNLKNFMFFSIYDFIQQKRRFSMNSILTELNKIVIPVYSSDVIENLKIITELIGKFYEKTQNNWWINKSKYTRFENFTKLIVQSEIIDRNIDEIIFKLYNITSDEIEIIKNI